jgi:hypothetical protein
VGIIALSWIKERLLMRYIILLLLATAAFAQSPRNVIWVDHSGVDAVGTRFVFEFKEEVRKSAGYQLETERQMDFTKDHSIWLDFLSVETADSGLSSAISVVATSSAYDFLGKCAPNSRILRMVLVVGRDRTQNLAHQLLADLDKNVHDARLCTGLEKDSPAASK